MYTCHAKVCTISFRHVDTIHKGFSSVKQKTEILAYKWYNVLLSSCFYAKTVMGLDFISSYFPHKDCDSHMKPENMSESESRGNL